MAAAAATPATTSEVRSDLRAASSDAIRGERHPAEQPEVVRPGRRRQQVAHRHAERGALREEHRDAADHGRRGRDPQHPLPLGDDAAEREQPDDRGGERQRESHVEQELADDAPHGGRGRRRHGDARCDDRSRRHVDAEAERAGRRMPVGLGDHSPADRVHAVGQVRGERDLELVIVSRDLYDRARLDRLAVDVQHVDERELRIGRLGERHRHRGGSPVEQRVGGRVGAGEVRVRGGGAGEAERQDAGHTERDQRTAEPPHVPPAIVNVVCAITRGSNGPWSAATNSASSVCSPATRPRMSTSCTSPYVIDTSEPSSDRWI